MATASNSPSRITIVPNHHFLDFPTLNHHHFTFIPKPQINAINPSFVGPVILPPLHLTPFYQALYRIEQERSLSLQQFMVNEGLVPSQEEETKRETVVDELKQIVMKWIERVASKRLPNDYVGSASAALLTYGSYGLGVHTSESDIDALCVGPCFANMAEDFFIVLHKMLASRPEVSDIHCIKDAKVPLMRFKFDGISVDLPYAQLQVLDVPKNVDILLNQFISESSSRSLSGVRANKSILQLVPDAALFRKMLRCIKFWAKRRGVYGNIFGFFGGVHLAVLVAFICRSHPIATLGGLISIFFLIFAHWEWPTPVILQNGISPSSVSYEIRFFMPIQLPGSHNDFCHSNITASTFIKIRTEFRRGNSLTKDLPRPHFDWSTLFELFPYSKTYTKFVKICLSAPDQEELGNWVGWVKSRFRRLLLKLEELLSFCDPNPCEYFDTSAPKPNIAFYWGLLIVGNDSVKIHTVEEDFKKHISNGYQGPPGEMGLSIVQASHLPKNT